MTSSSVAQMTREKRRAQMTREKRRAQMTPRSVAQMISGSVRSPA